VPCPNALLILVVFAVALIGAGLFYYRSRQTAKVPTPVTADVTRGNVVAKVDATGTLAPVTTVQVGSQVSGTVKALFVDYNAHVRKSQVIARAGSLAFPDAGRSGAGDAHQVAVGCGSSQSRSR
jgi:HlyD family secretion protein